MGWARLSRQRLRMDEPPEPNKGKNPLDHSCQARTRNDDKAAWAVGVSIPNPFLNTRRQLSGCESREDPLLRGIPCMGEE